MARNLSDPEDAETTPCDCHAAESVKAVGFSPSFGTAGVLRALAFDAACEALHKHQGPAVDRPVDPGE